MRRGTVLVCLLLLPTAVWTQSIDVYGLYGFDTAIMANRWNPLTLYVSGLPRIPEIPITVTATIDPAARPIETTYTVSRRVSPSTDGTALFRTIVPVGRFPLPVEVSIFDTQWSIKPRQWNSPDRLVVVVGNSIPEGNARLAFPVVETLPDHPLGYAAADTVIVGEAPFERATAGQIRALTHAVKSDTSLPVPIISEFRNDIDAVSNVLLSQPIYRFPSRWIVLLVLGTYLGALAVLGRSGSILAFTTLPVGLSLLFLVVYTVVDPPPAEVHMEVQRVEGVAGESGAVLIRDVLAMSIHGNRREVIVPDEAVVLPRPGEQVTVSGDTYVPYTGSWSSHHFSTVEIIPNPYNSPSAQRVGITARIDDSGIHYDNPEDKGKDPTADLILKRLLIEYGTHLPEVVEVTVSDGVVDPLMTVPHVDRVGLRSVSIIHKERGP